MGKLPEKKRHYRYIEEMVNHFSKDMSDEAMKKKALSTLFLQDFISPKPKNPRIVSSAHGSIDRILLTIPSCATGEEDNPQWKIFKNLFLTLPQYTHFIILTHQSSREYIVNWLNENGLENRFTIGCLADYIKFTVWAEDGYAVVKDADSGQTYFVEPHAFPRAGDELIADTVSGFTDLQTIQSPLYYEGGNILIGDDFFFIGADYAVKSLTYINSMISPNPGESKADLIYRLFHEYLDNAKRLFFVGCTIPVPSRQERKFDKKGERWREIYFIKNKGGTVQPLFHIDMFMTLAGRDENGKYRVLVGDPRMAADILGEPVSKYALAEEFDNIARNLAKLNFEVIRNPLPLTYLDDPEINERHWYFATANNALVEIKNEKEKTVWLPTYGYGDWSELKKTDEANKKIWENLGFNVVMLEDFHPFAENTGSVHCIKKYINRGGN